MSDPETVISLSNVKLSFIDELNKYDELFTKNDYKPQEAAAQLIKLMDIAEKEVEKNGSHEAINWYGWNLINGYHLFPNDVDKGIELLEKAMGMGSSNALTSLADIYSGIIPTAQEEKHQKPERAIHYYTKASEQGDGYASYRLACCYLDGVCADKNLPKALEYGERSQHQGNVYGMYLWGTWLFNGDIVAQNQDEAYALFYDAYESARNEGGHDWLVATLSYWMGYAIFHGEGVDQDKEEGFAMIEQAAQLEDAEAQTWLEEYATYRRIYDNVT